MNNQNILDNDKNDKKENDYTPSYFAIETKIITNNGYKNIENININDEVLTYKNTFKRVKEIKTKNENIYLVKSQGMLNTYCSGESNYYVRTMEKVWNNKKRSYERKFSEPYWKKVKELTKKDFLGINIPNFKDNPLNLDEEICWLLGRYVADGHIRHQKRKNRKNSYYYGVVYSVGYAKVDYFKNKIKKHKLTICKHTNSCHRITISSKELVEFIELNNFGRGAINKNIPNFILNLPNDLAENFLDGYMSGDGTYTNNTFKAVSISKNLIMELQLLVAKIYGTSSNVNHTKRSPKYIIENRIVNQKDTYEICFQKELKKQNNSFITKDIIWYPVKKIEKTNKSNTVFYLNIEEDFSYTANNFIVHN